MLEAKDIGFRYPRKQDNTLCHVSMTLGKGELVAVVGANGSGKSTLARLVAGSLAPTSGEVLLDGERMVLGWPHVGLVRQDPQTQLVSEEVSAEVAFGLLRSGLAQDVVDSRVRNALQQCGIGHLYGAKTSELSGGEQQRLTLAGALAFDPDYLVFDEPTSMLDSTSREGFLYLIDQLVYRNRGVLLLTHRIEEVRRAHRVLLLEKGCVAWQGSAEEFEGDASLLARASFTKPMGLGRSYGVGSETTRRPRVAHEEGRDLALEHVSYARSERLILDDLSLEARPGRVLLVSGRSGSGKTTTARVASGVLAPDAGCVRFDGRSVRAGRVGLCQQRPEDQLFCDTVLEDVMFGPLNRGCSRQEAQERAQDALVALGVDSALWNQAPYELSGGERRKAAVAGIIALDADAYVFDEPTACMDGVGKQAMWDMVRELAKRGKVIVVISHELDEWLPVVDDVALMSQGHMQFVGTIEEAMSSPAIWLTAQLVPPASMGRVVSEELRGDEVWLNLTKDLELRPRADRKVPLGKVPPFLIVLLLLGLTFWLFAAKGPWSFATCAVVILIMAVSANMRPRDVLGVLRTSVVVLAFAFVGNALVIDGSGDVPLVGTLGLVTDGVARGSIAVVRIGLMCVLAMAVARSMTAAELSRVLMAPLRPLRRRLDYEGLVTTVTLTLRTIPVAMEEYRRVSAAQLVRGASLQSGSIRKRIGSWFSVLVPVVVSLIRHADELSAALRERGYGAAPAKDTLDP